MPDLKEKSAIRLDFLDGLRGWGAVVVLLYHVFSDALPFDADIGSRLKFFIPFSGAMAIFVFFMVSGFSLSIKYLATGDLRSWVRIAAGRYVRLAVPILAACALVHLALLWGLIDPPAERMERFRSSLTFVPTFSYLLSFSLFDVFFNYSYAGTYIGPLWTMSIELIGSFVVLLTILIVRPLPLPLRSLLLLGQACLIVLFAPTSDYAMLALFPVGVAMADCFHRGWLDTISKPVGFGLVSAGCLIPLVIPYSITAWGLIGTTLLMVGCIIVPQIRNWLGGRLSVHLGKLSFPLYLVHGPILSFVGEPLMRHFGHGVLQKISIEMAVIVLSFLMAYAFLPINELAIRLSRNLGNLVVGAVFQAPIAVER